MRKFMRRMTAGILLAALVLTSPTVGTAFAEETVHVHAEDAATEAKSPLSVTEEELAGGKVLLVTKEMLDEKGSLTVDGGSFDRIVVTKEVEAKKVALKDVATKEFVIESGMACTFEVSGGKIANVFVIPPELEVIDYDKISEMLASGVDAAEVAELYRTYLEKKETLEATLPNLVIRDKAEVSCIQMSGSASLDLTDALITELQIGDKGEQDRLKVTVSGYHGKISVIQTDNGNDVNHILYLNLKNSEPSDIHIAGTEKSICYVEGERNSAVSLLNLTGSAQVILNVAAEKVQMDEKAEKAHLKIYSKVDEVVVAGDNNKISLTASAAVSNAVIEGDNVKVSSSGGSIDNFTATDAGSEIVYVPTESSSSTGSSASRPNPPVTPDEPVIPDKPDEPVTPDEPDEPVTPDKPDEPVIPDKPDEPPPVTPGEETHIHTWNVEQATCATEKKCTDPDCGFVAESATGIHTYSELVKVTEAGCETVGFTTYKCKYCDETEQRDIENPKGHSVTEWTLGNAVEDKSCTYTQEGICTVCGESVVSPTTVELHNVEVNVKEPATCKKDGTKVYICSDCHKEIKSESYSNPNAHSWDAGTEENGKTVYHCKAEGCTATKSVIAMSGDGIQGDALEANTYLRLDNAVEMSLDRNVCQQVASSSALKLSADTLGGTEKDEAVSGLTEAEKEQIGGSDIYDLNMMLGDEKVSSFNGTVTVSLPYTLADGEDPEAVSVWYIADDGTVRDVQGKYHNGFVSFETDHFSYYTVVRLAPEARCKLFGHLWISATTNPTCTEDGYTTSICQRCGATQITPGEKATGHNLVEEVVEQATCQHMGSHRYRCNNKNCPFYTPEFKTQGEHNPKETGKTQEATCVEPGYIEYGCSDCDKYFKKEEIKPIGHKRGEDGRCTVCGIALDCEHTNSFTLVKLAEGAESCLDGVVCTRFCLDCKSELNEWTVKDEHVYGVLDYIDLSVYENSCGGYVALRGCACGASGNSNWFGMSGTHSWSSSIQKERDERGRVHTVRTYDCQNECGISLKEDFYDASNNNCLTERHEEWSVFVNGEQKETRSFVIVGDGHIIVSKATLAEGSVSCEDGVNIKNICLACGKEFNEYSANHHVSSVLEFVDLSKYEGFCGGYLVLTQCPCGEDGWLHIQDDYYCQCQFKMIDNSWIRDKDGAEHRTQEYQCANCNAKVVWDYVRRQQKNCKAQVTGTLSIFDGDTLVDTYSYSYITSMHTRRTSVELLEGSKNCLDGVTVTDICKECGKNFGTWTSFSHKTRGVKKEFDLSSYEDTCGGSFLWYSCACGEEQFLDFSGGHEFHYYGEYYTDETGMEHYVETAYCKNCNVSYTKDRVRAQNQDCTAVASYEYKFFVGDVFIGQASFTCIETSHDMYTSETVLAEGSKDCEDGVICTEKCRRCGYSFTYETKWHARVLKEELDLSEYGASCGGRIEFYECACGSESYVNVALECDTDYGNRGYNFIEEKDGIRIYQAEYKCAVTEPKCSFHFLMERREWSIDTCHTKVELYFCLDQDGDGVYETKLKVDQWSSNNHSYDNTVEEYDVAEDGTSLKIRTSACECGLATHTMVYADYLGDESYRYRISEMWEEDGNTYGWEYVYDFSNPSYCSVIGYWVTSDGYRHEEWIRPACVTDSVTEWATCTQYAHGICLKCGNDNPLNPDNYGSPRNHYFELNESGDGYICDRCGLENENGQSGKIVLEDLSDESKYIAGYWNGENLVYQIYVFLVTETDSRMTDLEVTDNGTPFDSGSSTAYLSKTAVQEWAAANRVTEAYDVMFSFIPKNASVNTTYNVVFTED